MDLDGSRVRFTDKMYISLKKLKLVLIGYMGCGKSYYARRLAEEEGLEYLDLDEFIEEKENASIASIFENRGEVYFRKKESQYLSELLNTENNSVIALGGGTPCYGDNLQQVKSKDDVVSVYLQKNALEISKQLYGERSTRPLIAHFSNEEDLIEYISKHLFERQQFYLQADHKINLSQTKDNEEVLKRLSDIWYGN